MRIGEHKWSLRGVTVPSLEEMTHEVIHEVNVNVDTEHILFIDCISADCDEEFGYGPKLEKFCNGVEGN